MARPLRVVVGGLWDGTPVEASVHVALTLHWDHDVLEINVDAPFYNDPIPPAAPGATDGLWGYEVVELFLLGSPGANRAYTEIEIGPHGHHLLLRLEGVRNTVQSGLPMDYSATISGDRWRGRARVSVADLPQVVAYNAYAISGVGAHRRYLAAHRVPGPQPDFHRLGFFAEWPLGVKPGS